MIPSHYMRVAKHIHPYILTFVELILFCIPAQALDFNERVDRLFRKWDRTDTPGCSVAVVKDGEFVYEKSYGMASLKFGIPNSPDTIYRIGSNTKQFTVFAIYLLEQDGLLELHDDVQLYIDEFPDFGESITIQHLIHHTSGLRDYFGLMVFGGWNLMEDLINKEQALHLVSRQSALNFLPGENFIYSNTGYMLLAEIVARVSGQSFAEFAKERIFEPLGMTDTQCRDNHKKIVERYADPYEPSPEGGYNISPLNFSSVGEGGIISTVRDLAKWDQNFYDPQVGDRRIFLRMEQSGMLNNGTPTGYSGGLIVGEYNGEKIVYHGGDLGGYHGNLLRYPHQHLSIITLSNSADLDSSVLLEKSLQIADIYGDSPPTGISDFYNYEPALRGMGIGANFENLSSPDHTFNTFLRDIYNKNRKKDNSDKPQTAHISIRSDDAQQFLGLYYSEEVDGFCRIKFEDDLLKFVWPRGPHFNFTARTIRRDMIIFLESELLTGSFFRNELNEVIGFKISNPRVIDLEFRRADIVIKD